MERHLTDDELVLHYYGEMTDAVEEQASSHLGRCDACRANLARLQRVLAVVDAGAMPEADSGLEARVWRRLESQLAAGSGQPAARSAYRSLRTTHDVAWGAVAAMLVVAAFVAGRMSAPPAPTTLATTAAPAPDVDRVLTVDLGDHLDRAEVALVEFLARQESGVTLTAAEDLIAANRLYRGAAMSLGNDNVVTVLDELERALIEIAGAPDADPDEREAVRTWIDSRDLLFKMRVIREAL